MNQRWNIQCLDSFQLKCIAIVSMALDHTGAVLYPSQIWLRCLGRIAFPIFCFLIVEGFFHTHDVRRYMGRLGVFALISEIPYDLAFRGVPLEYAHQNVFFTLLIGIGMMVLLERNREWPVKAVILLLAMWLAVLIRSDYNFRGVLLIFVFYIFHESRWLAVTAGGFWNFLYQGVIQKYGVLSVLPLALYNGERGRKMKYFFYIFYPAHLLLLYGISRF
ncbi:TraX family protein [Merdimonas faecis]|uniref:TraX family protein n=1 Tax=Merdimonas faecis TaxID=1653435 RepID=UPI0023F6FB1C|nr:TraX family protein [Merdimonas faecis]